MAVKAAARVATMFKFVFRIRDTGDVDSEGNGSGDGDGHGNAKVIFLAMAARALKPNTIQPQIFSCKTPGYHNNNSSSDRKGQASSSNVNQ